MKTSDLVLLLNISFKLFPQYVAFFCLFLYKTYFGIFVELHENIRKQLQQKHTHKKNPPNLLSSVQSNISSALHQEEVSEEVHWITR